jgi:hypothetical protein
VHCSFFRKGRGWATILLCVCFVSLLWCPPNAVASGIQTSATSTDFIDYTFPATSADMNGPAAFAWLSFHAEIEARAYNPCMREQGFTLASELKESVPQPLQDQSQFPNIRLLDSGVWALAGSNTESGPPNLSNSEQRAFNAASSYCEAKDPFSSLDDEAQSLQKTYGQMVGPIHADPRVTKAWNNQFVSCVQNGGINVSSEADWWANLQSFSSSHNGNISPSLAKLYGRCVAPIAALLDKLRSAARRQLFDRDAPQLLNLESDVNFWVRKLTKTYGSQLSSGG